jgi:putative RNA 2'-phosphotransferase
VLYHGTPERNRAVVLESGLKRMQRHHVHLSGDEPTARKVGERRGKPILFTVDAAAMRRDGHTFYRSANGVWLVDEVPPKYLRLL